MSETVVVKLGNVGFHVQLPDIQNTLQNLERLGRKVMNGEEMFHTMWEDEYAEKVDILTNLEELKTLLVDIAADPNALHADIHAIRKKKNGKFWRNSGTDVYIANHCTHYFTDFTNAWSAMVLRLDVLDEDTCTLSIRQRTYTP